MLLIVFFVQISTKFNIVHQLITTNSYETPNSHPATHNLPWYCWGINCFSTYPAIFKRKGKEKCVLTFSFNIVSILKVYRIVLKHRMWGNFLKQALQSNYRSASEFARETKVPFFGSNFFTALRTSVHVVAFEGILNGDFVQRFVQISHVRHLTPHSIKFF